MPDIQSNGRAWRLAGRTGHHHSTGFALHTFPSETHKNALFGAVAGQSSSAVHLPVVGTGENGLTANAPGAMTTWLDTTQIDDNGYTIDRSSSENSQDCTRFSEDFDSWHATLGKATFNV